MTSSKIRSSPWRSHLGKGRAPARDGRPDEPKMSPDGPGIVEISWGVGPPATRVPVPEEDKKLTGFLVDLKAAYRQIPCRNSEHHLMIIAFWDPHKEKVTYASNLTKGFGAT